MTDDPKSTARGRYFGYAALALAIVVIGVAQSWPANDLVPWQTDAPAALARAEADDRPALLYFAADWCPPCKAMTRSVFSHQPTVDRLVDAVVPIEADLTARAPGPDHQFAQAMGAYAIPTFILFGPDGRELARRSGYLGRDELVNWVEALASEPAPR